MPESSPAADNLASEVLALVGREGGESASSPGDLFASATKKQLLDCAARLGLKGVSKLSREDLAGRVGVAFAGLAGLPPTAPDDHEVLETSGATPPANGAGSFPQKYDLGPSPEGESMPKDIPWGYGHDRITAMAVDPARLYVYWEATDSGIAAARTGLGPAGERAWLNVRVYDITGRLFDGTNAHSYFDHRVERHERQWFFVIDKPTSTACVEIGLKSEEGYFVKIMRSGRVEFPRNEPVGGGGTEWLSVRGASGPVGSRWAGAPAGPGGGPAAVGPGPVGGGAGPGGGAPGPQGGQEDGSEEWQDWTDQSGFPVPRGQRLFGRTWQRQESIGHQWTSEWAKTEWVGPVLRTEWESGPFAYPIDVPEGSIEVQDNGEVAVRTEGGRTHVMYGPWQVVIRGVGARAERRVLGTWEYRRQIAIEGGVERVASVGGGFAPGSSEWLMMGASERAWMGASELLWRGASELWLLGASEMLFGGASERAFLGGSEVRFRGASERRLGGASERRIGGATERMFAGASETMHGGASERSFVGASERFGGASENVGGRGGEPVYEHDPNSPYPVPPRGLK